MTVERRPEERALDRLILELREQSSPDLDWDRVEARLMREPKPEARGAFAQLVSRLRFPAMGLLAVATLAVVVVAHERAPSPVAPKVVAKISNQPIDGDKLALGTHVTAGNLPVVVEHRGRARWTLEPHATASVAEAGEFLTLRLESGALSAAVVPNPKPETFAVEVGGTRVAVHGTAFRVERAGEQVLVSVSEGTVAVEPTGVHSAPSFLLRRDSRGSFALDGRTGSVEGNASAVVHDTGVQSHRDLAHAPEVKHAHANGGAPHAASESSSSAPAVPAPASTSASASAEGNQPLPLQPSISDIESGVSAALVLMNRCFHDETRSTGNRVSASTGLTLTVAGDGTLQSVTFAPPLAPAVEDCAVTGLRSLTFARSVEGVTFTRAFELAR